jgi:hypothetical protein
MDHTSLEVVRNGHLRKREELVYQFETANYEASLGVGAAKKIAADKQKEITAVDAKLTEINAKISETLKANLEGRLREKKERFDSELTSVKAIVKQAAEVAQELDASMKRSGELWRSLQSLRDQAESKAVYFGPKARDMSERLIEREEFWDQFAKEQLHFAGFVGPLLQKNMPRDDGTYGSMANYASIRITNLFDALKKEAIAEMDRERERETEQFERDLERIISSNA